MTRLTRARAGEPSADRGDATDAPLPGATALVLGVLRVLRELPAGTSTVAVG